jgi:hypothetical protein
MAKAIALAGLTWVYHSGILGWCKPVPFAGLVPPVIILYIYFPLREIFFHLSINWDLPLWFLVLFSFYPSCCIILRNKIRPAITFIPGIKSFIQRIRKQNMVINAFSTKKRSLLFAGDPARNIAMPPCRIISCGGHLSHGITFSHAYTNNKIIVAPRGLNKYKLVITCQKRC